MCVLERNKVLPHILFGASFAETYQRSPAFGIAGFLAHGDDPTSEAYNAYTVQGYDGILSVWAETRDIANNLVMRCRTYAYFAPYDMCQENEMTIYSERHKIE